jgi:uncharacterized protein HemY
MSQYIQWLILTSLTGSPLGSALFLLVFWFTVDRFTLGLFPDPVRWFMRRRREGVLRRVLLNNPHDRRSRLELGQLLVDRGASREAVDTLRPNLEAGEDDVQTLFAMGAACVGAGFTEQGEKLLAHVDELSPEFRVGEVELVRGRARLARADFAGAKQSLEHLVQVRRGTIEGRVLLARALGGLGDDGAAALMRDQAWNEYVTAPGFQRRKERFWAWRARPSRPATWALVLVLAFTFFGTVVAPKISSWARAQHPGSPYVDPGLNNDDNE